MHQQLNENLQEIRDRIETAAKKSGRLAADVKMVAVSKYLDVNATSQLVGTGQTVLGESRPQVLWEKAEQLADHSIEWHMIGHLQRNKVNRTIPLCSLVHSVDSWRLLESIRTASVAAERTTNCLLEVNVSGEAAKHGLVADEVSSVLERAAGLDGIRICGLMGMGSLAGGQEQNRAEFAALRELSGKLEKWNAANVELTELSMGMSGDFEVAIEEGATIVRIGSVLFEGCQFE